MWDLFTRSKGSVIPADLGFDKITAIDTFKHFVELEEHMNTLVKRLLACDEKVAKKAIHLALLRARRFAKII
jgi:hypothetical protein